MKSINTKILVFQFNKFLFVGALNTALTYLIYIMGLIFFNYLVAYTISFVMGIIISYYLNANFVFKSANSLTKVFRFILIYIMQYLLGMFLLYTLVSLFKLNPALAPFLVVAVTAPFTFLLSRHVFRDSICI